MSFPNHEKSRSLGTPVNLIRFQWSDQDGGVTGYTDGDRAITFDGVIYNPITVEVPATKASGTLDKSRLEFAISKDTPIAELYRVYPPSYVTTLRIFQGHKDDPNLDFKTVWAGRVLGVRFEKQRAIFTAEPVSSASLRVGLRRPMSIGCPHVLYGPHCQADRNAATSEHVLGVGSVGSTTVVMPDGWATTEMMPNYLGGLLTWCADRGETVRTILGVMVDSNSTGAILALNGPTTDLEEGMTVRAVLGCNHQMDHCLDLHDNIHNYGGCPFIPQDNPLGQKNLFY